jgi:outer membrane immunogenic protein
MRLHVAGLACLIAAATANGAAAADLDSGAFDWSGFYIGGHAGYGFGALGTTNSRVFTDGTIFGVPGAYNPPQFFEGEDASVDFDGAFGGAQVGYNAAFGNFLIGLEADIDWSDISTASRMLGSDLGPTYDTKASLDWFGTVRARAGFTADRLLFYGTAGLAYGGGSGSVVITPGVPGNFAGDSFSASDSRTHIGYAVGAGVEAALTQHVTVRLEYLYMDLGKQDYVFDLPDSNGSIAYATSDVTQNLIRAGLNLKY